MLKKKNDAVTRVKAEQSKVPPVYFYDYSLRLAVKQLTPLYEGDAMGAIGGTCALVKFSTKRENLLGTIREQVEGEFADENNPNQFSSLDILCYAPPVSKRKQITTHYC